MKGSCDVSTSFEFIPGMHPAAGQDRRGTVRSSFQRCVHGNCKRAPVVVLAVAQRMDMFPDTAVLFHHGQSMLCAAKQLKGLHESDAAAIANEMVSSMPSDVHVTRFVDELSQAWESLQRVMKLVRHTNIVGTLGVCWICLYSCW